MTLRRFGGLQNHFNINSIGEGCGSVNEWPRSFPRHTAILRSEVIDWFAVALQLCWICRMQCM
jgi:hypothetical protein